MKKYLILLFILGFGSLYSQSKEIPQWFLNDLKANVGLWVADNSKYISEEEPYTQYAIEWSYGIGQTSMVGKLFGIVGGEPTEPFWEFRQYWDNLNQKGMLLQFGFGGAVGLGSLHPLNEDSMEIIQNFSTPDGSNYETRHLGRMGDKTITTTSFDKGSGGEWIERRTYKWVLQQ